MNYLKIRNWERWQSYRADRGQPPWIKLWRKLLKDADWLMLSDAEKGQLSCIWLLAAEREGKIPDNAKVVQQLCGIDKKPDLESFINKGFIEKRRQPDAKVTPERHQGDATVHISSVQDREDNSVTSTEVPKPVAFVEMPIKHGTETITEADIEKWVGIYGRIDVRATVLYMVGYWDSVPTSKRKTRGGIRRSITNWLAKDDSKAPVGSKGGGSSGYVNY